MKPLMILLITLMLAGTAGCINFYGSGGDSPHWYDRQNGPIWGTPSKAMKIYTGIHP